MTETTTPPMLSEVQKKRFSELCAKIKSGELKANKAYEYALMNGTEEDDKGFVGSFKSWLESAVEFGWLDKPEGSQQPQPTMPTRPATKPVTENKTNYVVPIVAGVIVAVVFIYAIKKFSKKD